MIHLQPITLLMCLSHLEGACAPASPAAKTIQPLRRNPCHGHRSTHATRLPRMNMASRSPRMNMVRSLPIPHASRGHRHAATPPVPPAHSNIGRACPISAALRDHFHFERRATPSRHMPFHSSPPGMRSPHLVVWALFSSGTQSSRSFRETRKEALFQGSGFVDMP